VYGAVGKTALWATLRAQLDKVGYVNQHGLSRKVSRFRLLPSYDIQVLILDVAAYFRLAEEVPRMPTA
jgi:hypothetical protein